MRIHLLSLGLLGALHALAQCPFDPTVTPNDLILCPNASSELSTQVYDSYQWYKDGNLIPGATSQTLPVQQYNDAGSMFSVSATLDGCTEMSPGVLVDSWVFLLPYVINGGDEPNHLGPEGELFFCDGDTLTFELGQPYTTNITWYKNGFPLTNEHGTVLTVTSSGTYTVSGAPGTCPDFVQQLGVDLIVVFTPPTQPTIEVSGDQLCAMPAGNSYQWYASEEPIAGNTQCIPITGGGLFYVYVDYGGDCQIMSDGLIIEGVDELQRSAFTLAPNPATAGTRISWTDGQQPKGTWALVDMSGRTVRRGAFGSIGSVWLDTRELPAGRYLFKPVEDAAWAPLPIAVVR